MDDKSRSETKGLVVEKEEKPNQASSKKKLNNKIFALAIPGGVLIFVMIFLFLGAEKTTASGKSIAGVSQEEIAKMSQKLSAIADSKINPEKESKNSTEAFIESLQNKEGQGKKAEENVSPGLENPEDFLNRSNEESQIQEVPPVETINSIDPKSNAATGRSGKVEEPSMMVYSRSKTNVEDLVREMKDDPGKSPEVVSIDSKQELQNLKQLIKIEKVVYNDLPLVKVFEGEFLDGIILNQIQSGVAESPVVVSLVKDFFDTDQRYVVFPSGSRVIGVAGTVTRQDQARMIILFHRIIMPNGVSVDISKKMSGLSIDGSMGVVSRVNEHLFKRYSSALLFGILDGLGALAQNRLKQTSGASFFVDRTSSNFDQVGNQVFSQYANIMPTVTVNAGHKVKIFMSEDIFISPYMEIKERGYAK